MKEIIKNNILIKGKYLGTLLFIPHNIKYLERHAFPWEEFIELKDEKYLSTFVEIWFSFPDGNCEYFYVSGKRNIYQRFRLDYCPFPPFVRHSKVSREKVYISPEFQGCIRIEKQKMAGDLYRCVNDLLQRVYRNFFSSLEIPDLNFEIDDTYDKIDQISAAAYGLETEQSCQSYLKKIFIN